MRKSFLAAVAVLTASLLAAAGATQAFAGIVAKQDKKPKLPKDACALVTEAQVASLVPSAAAPEPQTDPVGVSCHWKVTDDPSRPVEEQLQTLDVRVIKIPASKGGNYVKLSLKAEAKDHGAPRIKGLGSFAFQASAIPSNSEVKALVRGLVLSVEFSGSGQATDDQKAKTLDIAKAVAKKL